MTAQLFQDSDIGTAPNMVFDEIFDKASPDEGQPAVVATSPCTSQDSSTSSTAAVAPAPVSITGKFSDIEDKYHVDPRVLGSGHHGSVRECFDRATGQRYAVKTMCKTDPAIKLEGLAREISLLQEMNHHSIVRLVDVFEDAKYVHLVTDLCQGGELFDRIVEKSSADNGATCFTEEEATRIIHQVLASVSYIHKLGIVHRDIKPENILFETADENSPVKIIDFGLARKHSHGLEPPMTTVVGTPYYIAPEVLRKRYDKSCDLWSVGVVAYTLLCGYPPFNGKNNHETHKAVLRGQYYFHSEDWKGVSFEARNFVRRLLQMDPGRRMRVDDALNHPWLVKNMTKIAQGTQRDEESVEYVCRFKGMRMPTKRSTLRGGIDKQKVRKVMFGV